MHAKTRDAARATIHDSQHISFSARLAVVRGLFGPLDQVRHRLPRGFVVGARPVQRPHGAADERAVLLRGGGVDGRGQEGEVAGRRHEDDEGAHDLTE